MKEEITTQTGKSTNFFFGSVASDKNLHFEENDTDQLGDLDAKRTFINFKNDSGAQANILPLFEYRR